MGDVPNNVCLRYVGLEQCFAVSIGANWASLHVLYLYTAITKINQDQIHILFIKRWRSSVLENDTTVRSYNWIVLRIRIQVYEFYLRENGINTQATEES